MSEIVAWAEAIQEQLVRWRRHLHQYPECSFEEKETAAFVANVLSEIPGIKVTRNVGGYGVVGKLERGGGRTIALRADMDALPITEAAEVTYASKHRGVMHACGHDAHTAILLGAATLLSRSFHEDSDLNGTVLFLFQPAEESMDSEGKTGAVHLIEHGVLQDVEMAFALHVCPWHKKDTIQLHSGPSMGSIDVFKGTISGTGGHGAYPHLGTDPFWLLSQVLPALYALTARRISPLEEAVVSVGNISGGEANNVIPSKVQIEGTIRCYDETVRHLLKRDVARAFDIAKVFGGRSQCLLTGGEPALLNDEKAVRLIQVVAAELYPQHSIVNEPYGLGSEDFAHIAKETTAALFFLGCQPESGQYDLHTDTFQIDESCLSKGTSIMAATAIAALKEKEDESLCH